MKTRILCSLTKKVFLTAAPLVVFLVMWPATRSYALGIEAAFAIVDATVNQTLGVALAAISAQSTIDSAFQSNTLYPVSGISQIQNEVNSTISAFRPWTSQIMSVNINSASLSSSSQLESATRGGANVLPSQINTSYQATYGVPITKTGASLYSQSMSDMADAQAQDVLSLTSGSDFAANNLVLQAQNIENFGGQTAPGTAASLSVQAEALELQSIAEFHKLLAANLRLEASQLANTTGNLKQQMAHHIPASTYSVYSSNTSSTNGTPDSTRSQGK
jgi:hypothetical protein